MSIGFFASAYVDTGGGGGGGGNGPGFYVDGMSTLLTAYPGIHTALDFDGAFTTSGTDSTTGSGTYGGPETGYAGQGLNAAATVSSSVPLDDYQWVDLVSLIYLPTARAGGGNALRGLFSNGGNGNSQVGFVHDNDDGTWDVIAFHDQSGNDQAAATVTGGRWYLIGLQYEDNANGSGNTGNMAVWIDGVKETTVAKTSDLKSGGGNPEIGSTSSVDPVGYGSPSDIDGTGILIASLVVDSPFYDTIGVNPPGNGDVFYEDAFAAWDDSGGVAAVEPIEFVAADQGTATATDLTFTIPATVTDDDRILISVGQSNTGAMATPTGFVAEAPQTNSVLVVNQFRRVAVAADASQTVTITNPGGLNLAGSLTVWRNVNAIASSTARVDQSGVASIGSPVATSDADDSVHVITFFERSTSVTGFGTPSAGVVRSTSVGTGGGHVSVLVASQNVVAGPVAQVDCTVTGGTASRAVSLSTVLTPFDGGAPAPASGWGDSWGDSWGS